MIVRNENDAVSKIDNWCSNKDSNFTTAESDLSVTPHNFSKTQIFTVTLIFSFFLNRMKAKSRMRQRQHLVQWLTIQKSWITKRGWIVALLRKKSQNSYHVLALKILTIKVLKKLTLHKRLMIIQSFNTALKAKETTNKAIIMTLLQLLNCLVAKNKNKKKKMK